MSKLDSGDVDKVLDSTDTRIKIEVEGGFMKFLERGIQDCLEKSFDDGMRTEVEIWLVGSEETVGNQGSPNIGYYFDAWFNKFSGNMSQGEFREMYEKRPVMVLQSMIYLGIIPDGTPEEYLRRLTKQFKAAGNLRAMNYPGPSNLADAPISVTIGSDLIEPGAFDRITGDWEIALAANEVMNQPE